MKKVIIFAALAGVMLLLSTFTVDQNFSRSYHHLFTNSTDLGQENVDGLFVNDDYHSRKVVEKYGVQTEQSRDVEKYDYFELTDGIEVAVNDDGKMTRFLVIDAAVKTAEGIKIDDEKEAVIQAYGKNYYVRREQGLEIIGYVDKKRNTSLEFWLYDNRVGFFQLDQSSME